MTCLAGWWGAKYFNSGSNTQPLACLGCRVLTTQLSDDISCRLVRCDTGKLWLLRVWMQFMYVVPAADTAYRRSRYIPLYTCTPVCRSTSLLSSTPVCRRASHFVLFNGTFITCSGGSLAMSSTWRPWMNVFAREIQHGGDWERFRPQGPKNFHNFLMTVRLLSWQSKEITQFCTRSICGWNLFQPLGLGVPIIRFLSITKNDAGSSITF